MKVINEIIKKSSAMELALFAGIVCLALTAGYASVSNRQPGPVADITGSAHPMKVAPMTTMQAMPDAQK